MRTTCAGKTASTVQDCLSTSRGCWVLVRSLSFNDASNNYDWNVVTVTARLVLCVTGFVKISTDTNYERHSRQDIPVDLSFNHAYCRNRFQST